MVRMVYISISSSPLHIPRNTTEFGIEKVLNKFTFLHINMSICIQLFLKY